MSSPIENRAKWVAALRSGDYKQGAGQLCYEDGDVVAYCCLGVACELARANGVAVQKDDVCSGVIAYDDCEGSLPESVQKWLGLSSPDGALKRARRSRGASRLLVNLADLNDDAKYSFARLAKIVESGQVKTDA